MSADIPHSKVSEIPTTRDHYTCFCPLKQQVKILYDKSKIQNITELKVCKHQQNLLEVSKITLPVVK